MIEYKNYYIKPAPTGPKCYYIATVGRGGKIPDVMNGFFTSPTWAMGVIDSYIASKDKSKEDGKEISKD